MSSDFNASEFNLDETESSNASFLAQFSADNICGEGGACVVYRINLDGVRVAVKRLREDLRTLPGYAA